jgi:hypothetical protein
MKQRESADAAMKPSANFTPPVTDEAREFANHNHQTSAESDDKDESFKTCQEVLEKVRKCINRGH